MLSVMVIFVDTNLIIDFLTAREPYYQASSEIINLCAKKEIIGYMAFHSISNLWYILRKVPEPKRRQWMRDICKCLQVVGASHDEVVKAIDMEEFKDFEAGFLSAVNILVEDSNPLFDSLINKLCLFPELNFLISRLLFHGQRIAYNADNAAIRNAQMFGFVKIKDSSVQIANKLFETRLYNRYLLEDKEQNSSIFMEAKEIGVKEIVLGDKVLVEAVV